MNIDIGRKISVVMITMDEEKAVRKVIHDIQATVPGAEIILVDSSRDKTPEIATSLGATVIRQFPPRGYSPAMDRALRSATRDVIVTMDCDDTYPVSYIEPMTRMILEEGYDVVDGSRLKTKPEAMPWINFLANWGFALIASVMFGRRLLDLHSGMRAYRKGVIEKINANPVGVSLPVELLLRPIRMGMKVAIVFIPYRERVGQSKMRPLQAAWWTVRRIVASRFM